MSTKISYFYIIQDTQNGIYYAGSKYGKDANPENFMIEDGYTTSSNIINELIIQTGLKRFIVRKLKTFENTEQALIHETKFLLKVNAANNPRFYNCHNNSLTVNLDKMQSIVKSTYDVDNFFQLDWVKQKIKSKNLCNLGVEYPFQSSEVLEKSKNTNLAKLGVEWPSQSPIVRKKIEETNMNKRGVINVSQDTTVQQKKIETNLKRTGYEWPLCNPDLREIGRKTMIEKYGVDHPMKSHKIKQKHKDTTMKNYGVEHPMKSEIIKSKTKSTIRERFGDLHPFNSIESRKKGRETKTRKLMEANMNFVEIILKNRDKFVDKNWIFLAASLIKKKPSAMKGWLLKYMRDFYFEVKNTMQ